MYSHPGGDRIRFRRVFYFEKKPRVLTPRLNYVFGPQIEYVQIYSRTPECWTLFFPFQTLLILPRLKICFPFTAAFSKRIWMVRSWISTFLTPFSFHSFLLKNLQWWTLDGKIADSFFSHPIFLSKFPSQTAARMNFLWTQIHQHNNLLWTFQKPMWSGTKSQAKWPLLWSF